MPAICFVRVKGVAGSSRHAVTRMKNQLYSSMMPAAVVKYSYTLSGIRSANTTEAVKPAADKPTAVKGFLPFPPAFPAKTAGAS
ncbi:hypothetical protein D3C81_1905270 [compost metagenome]